MDRRQRLLLQAIHSDPVPDLVPWEKIEEFLEELGCVRIRVGRWDSAAEAGFVRFMRWGVVATFQRGRRLVWHYQIEDLREFLGKVGLGL